VEVTMSVQRFSQQTRTRRPSPWRHHHPTKLTEAKYSVVVTTAMFLGWRAADVDSNVSWWEYHFPTPFEAFLWRVSCIVMTVVPLASVLVLALWAHVVGPGYTAGDN
jgi:hypothetical protein